MVEDPTYWQKYYPGDEFEQAFKRKYSFRTDLVTIGRMKTYKKGFYISLKFKGIDYFTLAIKPVYASTIYRN